MTEGRQRESRMVFSLVNTQPRFAWSPCGTRDEALEACMYTLSTHGAQPLGEKCVVFRWRVQSSQCLDSGHAVDSRFNG